MEVQALDVIDELVKHSDIIECDDPTEMVVGKAI